MDAGYYGPPWYRYTDYGGGEWTWHNAPVHVFNTNGFTMKADSPNMKRLSNAVVDAEFAWQSIINVRTNDDMAILYFNYVDESEHWRIETTRESGSESMSRLYHNDTFITQISGGAGGVSTVGVCIAPDHAHMFIGAERVGFVFDGEPGRVGFGTGPSNVGEVWFSEWCWRKWQADGVAGLTGAARRATTDRSLFSTVPDNLCTKCYDVDGTECDMDIFPNEIQVTLTGPCHELTGTHILELTGYGRWSNAAGTLAATLQNPAVFYSGGLLRVRNSVFMEFNIDGQTTVCTDLSGSDTITYDGADCTCSVSVV